MSAGPHILKQFGRRIAAALGVRKSPAGGWHMGRGRERSSAWYDKAYACSEDYREHYTQSLYYPLWVLICELLETAGARRVLEIGCGAGQLARMLLDRGVEKYVGLDFSAEAVEIARRQAPGGEFIVGDARSSSVYTDREYDAIVCTEVLEHVEEDLAIVSRFGAGAKCLCSVPNFPHPSHVRHFRSPEEARRRYEPYFDGLKVLTVRSPRNPRNEFYLLHGRRSTREVTA